jgi:tetratricopeptide (TPR) repeat protein
VAVRATAQPAAYASNSTGAARTLAKQALDCLDRGEDAATRESKLAAYREGLAFAERAVAADDGNADAHFAVFANQGRIMLMEGVVANPLSLLRVNRELDRVLELNPDHTDALAAKGGMYRQLPWVLGGSLEKAEACLRRVIELDPTAVAARMELAETYREMGQPDRGVPLLEKAASIAKGEGKHRQLARVRDLLREMTPVR